MSEQPQPRDNSNPPGAQKKRVTKCLQISLLSPITTPSKVSWTGRKLQRCSLDCPTHILLSMKHSHNNLVEVSVNHPEIDDIVKYTLALSYAFEQCQKVDNWKFNKARQNWLLCNIWPTIRLLQDFDEKALTSAHLLELSSEDDQLRCLNDTTQSWWKTFTKVRPTKRFHHALHP